MGYKIIRFLLKPIFKLYYNPKIENMEVIPREGPIIVCGHHKHLFDQCLPIMATPRVLCYMAKKEYFDNKKIAWFFKMAGCIPVDRSKKDEHATSSALAVLNDGRAIGIFPEGTRNALKDERIKELYDFLKIETIMPYKKFRKQIKKSNPKNSQIMLLEQLYHDKKIKFKDFQASVIKPDPYLISLRDKKVISADTYERSILLPLKFGTVSMAKKTNATIVPFGIVGNYTFRSKDLKAKFGEPFKVGDMDLEEANEKLFQAIKDLSRED